MIRFAAIPHSDSVLLSAISLGQFVRSKGHEFRLALDTSSKGFPLMKILAEQGGEDLVSIQSLQRDRPDVVFFESSQIATHAFSDLFRINFTPGVFWIQRNALFSMGMFALGNISFSSNFLAPYVKDLYGGNIPELGLSTIKSYPQLKERKLIVFPDGFPISDQGRAVWFSFLERLASKNSDYDVVIKERFPSDYFPHVKYPSYKDFFSSATPANLRISSFKESTRKLIAESACVVGSCSSILVEAAMLGKKVCLVDVNLIERYAGIPATRDWFTRHGLRVPAVEAEIDPIGTSLMTAESLSGFVSDQFNGEWLVNAVEMIFDYFPDSKLRNSLKYDLSVGDPILPQLSAIAASCSSPEIEHKKNLSRYEYSQSLSQAVVMLNFIAPDMANEDIVAHVKRWFKREDLPLETAECRLVLDEFRCNFADYIVKNVYKSESLDFIFGEQMHYDLSRLMPAYYIVDALERSNRNAEAHDFEKKLNHSFAEKQQDSGAAYANAVALKRMGRVQQAFTMLEKISNRERTEALLRSGAYFHMGEILYNSGDRTRAASCFSKCLDFEKDHKKAQYYLNLCQN